MGLSVDGAPPALLLSVLQVLSIIFAVSMGLKRFTMLGEALELATARMKQLISHRSEACPLRNQICLPKS